MKAPKGKAKAEAKADPKSKAVSSASAKIVAAKAKAKAKSKAKAKCKAKSKAADPTPEEPKKEKIVKGSVKDLKKRLMGAADQAFDETDDIEEHENDEDDEEKPADTTTATVRDRVKSNKFDAMHAKGLIPSHIIDMLSDGSKDNKNARLWKTQIVNNLFNRDSSGKLTMCPHAPFFTAWKQTQETHSMAHKEKALPRTVFMGKYFNNSSTALDNAVSLGEVDIVEANGKQFYSFQTFEKSHTRAKTAFQKVLTTAKKIDGDTSQHLSNAFDNLAYNFKRIGDGPSSSSSAEPSTSIVAVEVQPPLTGDEVFEKVKTVFEDAKAAIEKIGREIMKLVSKTVDDPKTTTTLYLVLKHVTKCLKL